MKKKLVVVVIGLAFFLPNYLQAQVAISDIFYAQNYWLPDREFDGRLEEFWTEIEASGVTHMRVGGIAYDYQNNEPVNTTHVWSTTDLCATTTGIIDEIRSYGNPPIQPILQVPIDITKTIAENCTSAVNLITAVNVTNNKGIEFWQIGNEPNTSYAGVNNYNDNAVIANYIRQVSSAMKNVLGQSNIKIIGPSFSYYHSNSYRSFLGSTLFGCSTCDITGVDGFGRYHIDYIDYHTYPFQSECYWVHGNTNCTGTNPPDRTDVVEYLAGSGNFKDNLQDIINYIPIGRINNLKITITEANISYEQNTAESGVLDLGPGSYLGGQFWAELMGISMEKGVALVAPWSVIEGTNQDPDPNVNDWVSDIGYISSETGQRRSSYWHYKMIADNFKGNYYSNPLNTTTFKAFSYVNTTSPANEIGVLVMNQTIQSSPRGSNPTSQTLGISFDNSTLTQTLKVKLNITTPPTDPTYDCKITNETSMLLIFDRTTGDLISKKVYNLGDALRPVDTGPETWGLGSSSPIVNQDGFNSYYDAVYTNLVVTPASNISLSSPAVKIMRFSNTGTINGGGGSNTFTVNTGTEFTLLPTLT